MRAFAHPVVILLLFAQAGVAQQSRGTTISPSLFGSVPPSTVTSATISLSMADTIDRALKYNLGTIISEQETRVSRAERLRALSELMPKLTASVNESVQQTNLAAFGFSAFPGVPQVVGPFSTFDVRARYSHSLVDLKLLHELRSAAEQANASTYAQQDVRELVVLVATDLYLQVLATGSRVEAARAQLRTAQAVYDRAVNLRDSGVAPGIDVLRAQVQLQAQQQRVLAAENDLAKQKLNLARAIGLPQAQTFTQSDSFATTPMALPTFEQALATALESRSDYRRAQTLVRAAEETRKAAVSRRLPSIEVNADYGDIGRAPGFSHGTMGVAGRLVIPVYTGERTRAEVLESDGLLEQRKAETASLRDRIEFEIRTANLDIQSSADQVRVAQGARDLAQQQLVQAQDRFAAGVTTGLEVTQAQQAVTDAEESYISSVFALNVAEASLLRAMGTAERTIKTFLGGK